MVRRTQDQEQLKLSPATFCVPGQVAHLPNLSVLSCAKVITNRFGRLLPGLNLLMSVELQDGAGLKDGIKSII